MFVGYRLFGGVDAIAGLDYLRYAFDFNPVASNSPVVAGGAVDQYVSGWLGFQVHSLGSTL